MSLVSIISACITRKICVIRELNSHITRVIIASMIKRCIEKEFLSLLKEYPVVTLLGPRQAGKTTLAKELLPQYTYSNLEVPDVRGFASEDPKGYLAQFKDNVIIDEIQRVPDLLSYIQVLVDEKNTPGQFVVTGSHQMELRSAISQSLAGRTAILHLLPLSITELADAGINYTSFEEYAFRGFLPRIHDKAMRPSTAYSNYYQTYVERDVRLIINLKNVSQFEKLMMLIAGRVGQLVDYTSLANDVGVTANTIRDWISILEASYIVFKLPPYFENFGKRVIKAPKYYFTDVGLLCFLLGIRKAEQISRDPLVGSIFENLVILEALKERYNNGEMAGLYFFRDNHGNEVDLIAKHGRQIIAAEIKSAATFKTAMLKGLMRFNDIATSKPRSYLIYNGDPFQLSNGTQVCHYSDTHSIFS